MTDEIDPRDGAVGERLDALCEQLRATGTLPVSEAASRWLGEAEAVAADALAADRADAAPETVARRVEQVRELLAHVEAVEHPEAAERLEAARALADGIAAELGERGAGD